MHRLVTLACLLASLLIASTSLAASGAALRREPLPELAFPRIELRGFAELGALVLDDMGEYEVRGDGVSFGLRGELALRILKWLAVGGGAGAGGVRATVEQWREHGRSGRLIQLPVFVEFAPVIGKGQPLFFGVEGGLGALLLRDGGYYDGERPAGSLRAVPIPGPAARSRPPGHARAGHLGYGARGR